MRRREFLVRMGAITVVLPVAAKLVGCGGGELGGAGTGTETEPEPQGPQPSAALTVETTEVNGHIHQVTIGVGVLSTPPSDGVDLPTTVVQAHSHRVELTREDLQRIAAGATLTRVTTLDDGHTHLVSFGPAAG